MTEIMPELLGEITDESIMAEVSDKLNIGSYDGDGYESGESGYDSPRTESRDFITMTDVDDNEDVFALPSLRRFKSHVFFICKSTSHNGSWPRHANYTSW